MTPAEATRPVSGPPRPFRFPDWSRTAVPGGGSVVAAHLPGRPMATAMLVLDAGAVTEPAGREGVALLTARLLSEGTGNRDAYAFAVAAERLGAGWSAEVDWDSMRVGFDVPLGALPAAVDLLAEAVRTPTFDEVAVARLKAERVDELGVAWSQPGPRAAAAFADALWVAGSRYARDDGGDLASVPELNRDDVLAFHTERVQPAGATLVVAGDLTGVDVPGLAGRLFDGAAPAVAPTGAADDPAAPSGGGRRVVLVHRPGAVQSMLVMGHPGPPRRTPDYMAATTMALAFGGMFNSRLNYQLRERRGFTYGAFAGFDLRRHGGTFAMRAAVHAAATADAVDTAAAELARMHEGGVEADELETTKSYRAGIFPISFAQPHAVAGALGDLVVHGLPDDYFDTLRDRIGALTVPEVSEAAVHRLAPTELVTVVVGDAEAGDVAERLTAHGPVVRVDDP